MRTAISYGSTKRLPEVPQRPGERQSVNFTITRSARVALESYCSSRYALHDRERKAT